MSSEDSLLSIHISHTCIKFIRQSANQHDALDAKGRSMGTVAKGLKITPDQNPRHKEQEKRSLIRGCRLQIYLRGLLKIVPYFNIQVRPIQASKVTVIYLLVAALARQV